MCEDNTAQQNEITCVGFNCKNKNKLVCCKDFTVTDMMISLCFNSEQMYMEGSNNSGDEDTDIIETLCNF